MSAIRTSPAARRNGLALGLSALAHLAVVLLVMGESVRPYDLPAPEAPPIQMEITPPIEPVEIPPRLREKLRQDETPQPLKPVPTPTEIPQKTPAPTTATPAIKLSPVKAASARPSPTVTSRAPISAQLNATAIPDLAPTPAPPAPLAAATPAPIAMPKLNLHKSEKQAPAGVPTLPLAPPPPPGGAQSGGGAPSFGGSRLQGLSPYPGGVMPGGGAGLRGSLVGCANAEAAHLSAVERARCATMFGADIAHAPRFDGISAEKRAGFDAQVQKSNAWKQYRDGVPANGSAHDPISMEKNSGPPQGLYQDYKDATQPK